MQIHRGIEQGSQDWFALRIGKPTASRFKDVLAGGKGLTRNSYMMQLAAEILTGEPAEKFSNDAMDWGTATEPMARDAYQFITDNEVEQVTFITNDLAGYSPDAMIGSDGLLEIKCPKTTTHIETVLSGKMPSGHIPQVQGGLWISEREWLDFVSYDPRIKTEKSFFTVRIYRDDPYIKNLAAEVARFREEILDILEKMV